MEDTSGDDREDNSSMDMIVVGIEEVGIDIKRVVLGIECIKGERRMEDEEEKSLDVLGVEDRDKNMRRRRIID